VSAGPTENTTSLPRQTVSKATDFSSETKQQIDQAAVLLNNRTGKTRLYETPGEIFASTFVPLI